MYNTLEEIFSDSKMIPDLLHLGCSDSPAFTYSTISKSSENPRTFIDSDIKYLHFRFRIQNLGRRDENWTFSFPFFQIYYECVCENGETNLEQAPLV